MSLLFRKRIGVLLTFILLCATGAVLVTRLSVQLYPRTNRPTLTTSIRHDGYSAIGFSSAYAQMIEGHLVAIPGAELVVARYGSNQSSFTITFDWEVDAHDARASAEVALTTIGNQLPSDLGGVSRVRFSTGENAGFLITGISSPSVTAEDLHRIVSGSIEDRLNQIPDADVVEVLSVEGLRVDIVLHQHEMLNYGITIADVNHAMRSQGGSQSAGRASQEPATHSKPASQWSSSRHSTQTSLETSQKLPAGSPMQSASTRHPSS